MKKVIPPCHLARTLAITALVTAVFGGPVQAATKDWNPPSAGSGGSTAWATGANWGGTAPVNDLTTDIARFDQTSYNFQPNAGTTSITGIEIGDGTTATAALTLSGTSLSIGASGITKFANSGTATFSSPIVLGAAQTWTNNSSSTLDITGAVSGSNALTIAGTGSVTLRTATNTYSAGTTIKSGTLIAGVGSSAAIEATVFGTGAITLGDSSGTSSATLAINLGKSPTVTNAITIASGSSGTLTMTSNGGGLTNMSGAIALNHDLTLSNTGASAITYSGVITGSKDITVNTTSTGQVIFSGNNQSTWTGNLYVTSGLFRISGETSTTKSLSASNTLYIASGGTFQNNNNTLTIAGVNDFSGGGGVIDNTANNARDLTFGGSGNYSFSGIIQNSGGVSSSLGLVVALTGSGSQTLSGSNSYVGNTAITSGILNIRNSSALGSTALGTSVTAGATLQLQGTISVGAEALTINGLGAAGQNGALVNVSGTNSFGGQLTMGSNVAGTAISSDNSGTLNLTNTGTISNASTRTLILTGSGNGSLAGVLTAGSISKSGTGTWTLSGADTYTGATSVSAGTLLVSGSLTSAMTATTGTIGGSGSTTGNVTIGDSAGGHDAYIAPGNGAAGTFTTTGSMSLLSDATYAFELNGTTGSVAADKVVATGLTINSSALFSFTLLGDKSGLSVSQPFTIMHNTSGNISGAFSNLAAGGTFDAGGGLTFNVSGGGGVYGSDLVLTVATVPEPATWALLAFSLTTVVVLRRRRN